MTPKKRITTVATPVADRGPFDAIVSSYLPKYVDPERLLDNVLPALRPGGVVVLHDFTRPAAPIPWLVWRAWYAVLESVAPRRHPEWRNVYRTVEVALSTHDAGGVTALDVELARSMNAIARQLGIG